MNLANKITMSRLLILPFVIIFLYMDNFGRLISLALFILIMIGDKVDGMVARKLGVTSDFGNFFDGLADKVITSLMFIILLDLKLVPLWAVLLIIARDVSTESIRSLNMSAGIKPKRSLFSKFKTGMQDITILFALWINFSLSSNFTLPYIHEYNEIILNTLIYVTVFFAYYSLIQVIYSSRKRLLKDS
ncbi:MAG: CDP-alcohol phosphatidyltransferase family protein [Nanoarchaeota archaeon]|nr:CDP-alcohol phosphatidyltransferase family protein [Nanoarchaeota archaeon]MBU1703974.1 CDP-alcohol phosphatidyltransferase family protein [Nanoarchaeota archaeon]